MKKIPFKDLSWPKAMNLEILIRILPEEKARLFICELSRLDRKDRRIILPSEKCIRKVLCFYYWQKVETGEATWEQIKKDLRREFKTLKSIGLKKQKVKKQYLQRAKEIKREENLYKWKI